MDIEKFVEDYTVTEVEHQAMADYDKETHNQLLVEKLLMDHEGMSDADIISMIQKDSEIIEEASAEITAEMALEYYHLIAAELTSLDVSKTSLEVYQACKAGKSFNDACRDAAKNLALYIEEPYDCAAELQADWARERAAEARSFNRMNARKAFGC